MRRSILAFLFLACVFARAETAPTEITPECERSIRKGLDYLIGAQASDGSWGHQNRVAKTALCAMALMADGSVPQSGRHVKPLRRALAFLLAKSDSDGVVTDDTYSWANSHNHGYALLCFAMAFGEAPPELQERIGAAIRKGIQATLRGQGPDGGWGYSVRQIDLHNRTDEGSCSVVQLQALRACKDVGFVVPKEHVDKAVSYLRACAESSGGFKYSLSISKAAGGGPGEAPRFSVAAAAMACLDATGRYKDPVVERGIGFLRRYEPMGRLRAEISALYGLFYATQVFYVRGGDPWKQYCKGIQTLLISNQDGSGKWTGLEPTERVEAYGGSELNTAFALLVLELPYRLLPLYQK